MRKLLRILLWTASCLAILVALACFVVYRAWRHEPEFYVDALQAVPAQQERAGDELVKNVLDLRNDVLHEGRWEATFTDKQINGWLAIDLPNKFADAVPSSIQQPRVGISPNQIQVACRYADKQLTTVVSLTVDVRLTDDPNVIAIRVRKARAGRIPLPLNRFIDQLKRAAKDSEVELRWAQEKGDPVALVRIPIEHQAYEQHELRIETIELRQGELRIVGRSGHELANGFIAGTSLSNQLPGESGFEGSDPSEPDSGESGPNEPSPGDLGSGEADADESEPTKRVAQEPSLERDKVNSP